MATLTIRDLNPETKQKLRERAARNGRSMEAEARLALDMLVADESERGESAWDAMRRIRDEQGLSVEMEDFEAFDKILDKMRRGSGAPRDPFADWTEADWAAL
jgi:plasmid stability protein